MNNDTNISLVDNDESDKKQHTIMLAFIGVGIAGFCLLFSMAFLWFQPNQPSLLVKYFPSHTPTPKPTLTPAPSRTPLPNLTATQQAWVKPSQSPSLGTVEEASSALDSGVDYLEAVSLVFPDMPDITQPGDLYIFEIQLTESEPLVWSYGWCTTTLEILDENFQHIQLAFTMNEMPIPLSNFAITESQREDGSPCREYAALVNTWPQGQHQLETHVTFTQDIDDGWNVYPAGAHTFKYIVTIQP